MCTISTRTRKKLSHRRGGDGFPRSRFLEMRRMRGRSQFAVARSLELNLANMRGKAS